MPSSNYGDISPRTAAYASANMLERAMPFLCMAKFGQQQPIPKNKTQTIRLRRYNALPPSTVPLVEGVTPAADNIIATDVQAQLQQYGRRTQITDVIMDTHEDPVLQQYSEIMGELAGQTMEMVIYNVLKAGTNVLYSGSSNGLRTGVNSAVTTTVLNRSIRALKRQNAKLVTRMLAATDKVGTAPIRAGFIAFCHPDVQTDLENLTGWKDKSEYGTYSVVSENEIGSFKEIRFCTSTLYSPFLLAGTANAGQTTFLTNGNGGGAAGACDVYPIVIVGADAFGTVSLAGSTAVSPTVVNPKPSDSDPLGQRGHVGFKMWATAIILNDAWMMRVECAVNQ